MEKENISTGLSHYVNWLACCNDEIEKKYKTVEFMGYNSLYYFLGREKRDSPLVGKV